MSNTLELPVQIQNSIVAASDEELEKEATQSFNFVNDSQKPFALLARAVCEAIWAEQARREQARREKCDSCDRSDPLHS